GRRRGVAALAVGARLRTRRAHGVPPFRRRLPAGLLTRRRPPGYHRRRRRNRPMNPQSLFETLQQAQADRNLPPVHRWQPERVGRIDIRIAADGTWYHEGDPIRRDALVRLFATVLRKDPDGFCLVTPAEKLLIEVEDAPFVAVALEVEGQGRDAQLLFSTNVDDHVVADAQHPLRVVELPGGEPRPYVTV